MAGIGRRIGVYEIVRHLGQGGMGTVYEVHDPHTDRRLALKLLPHARAEGKAATRFVREARALAQVRHPNVVAIHDVGEDPAGLFYVMDLVPGQELGKLAMSGRVPERDAAELALGVSEAVAAIHAVGLLHRDVKPDNVVLRADRGTPVLLDFGLALAADSDRLTRTGQIVGTPYAMSPEQASGQRDLSPATDVYGVGVILFMLLAGRPPFESDHLIGLLAAVCRDEPEWPAASPALQAILRCAMAKDPDQRYATAAELSADLQRYLGGERVAAAPPSSSLPRWLAGIGFALLLLAAGLAWGTREEPAAVPSPSVEPRPTRTRRVRAPDPLRELSRARVASGEEGRRLIAAWLRDFPDHPKGAQLRRVYLARGFKEPVQSWALPSPQWTRIVPWGERLVLQGESQAWDWSPGQPPERILTRSLTNCAAGPRGWVLLSCHSWIRVKGTNHLQTLSLLSPVGEQLSTQTHTQHATSVATDGQTIWVGHRDGTVVGVSWEEATTGHFPTKIATLTDLRSRVASIAIDSERKLLFATCGMRIQADADAPDRRLIAWSIATLPPTKVFEVDLPGSGGNIQLHPTQDLLALAVLWVQEIRIYNYEGVMQRSLAGIQAKTGTTSLLAGSSEVTAHSQQIRGLRFLPSGLLLSSSGKAEGTGELRAWDPLTGEEIATKMDEQGVVYDIQLTPRGEVFTSRWLGTTQPGLIEQWDFVPRLER
ncbi:MAG: serine/threonine protein kinase [Planctomycetes bacterium]|nr:serine/threonine protein kinase [Planctomycetota bacterium]